MFLRHPVALEMRYTRRSESQDSNAREDVVDECALDNVAYDRKAFHVGR